MSTKNLTEEQNEIKVLKKRTNKPDVLKKASKAFHEKNIDDRLVINFFDSEIKKLYNKLIPKNMTKKEFQKLLLETYEKTLK